MKSNNEIMEISNTNDTKLPLTLSLDKNVKTEITTTLQQKPNHKLGSNIQKFNMKSIRHEQETKISKHQKPSIKKIFNFFTSLLFESRCNKQKNNNRNNKMNLGMTWKNKTKFQNTTKKQ